MIEYRIKFHWWHFVLSDECLGELAYIMPSALMLEGAYAWGTSYSSSKCISAHLSLKQLAMITSCLLKWKMASASLWPLSLPLLRGKPVLTDPCHPGHITASQASVCCTHLWTGFNDFCCSWIRMPLQIIVAPALPVLRLTHHLM